MSTPRPEVLRALSAHPASVLRPAAREAGLVADSRATAEELAHQLTAELWWHYTTPLGYAMDRGTLDEIVDHIATRCRITLPDGNAWERANALVDAIAPRQSSTQFDDLHPAHRQRLQSSWISSTALGGGAAGALGIRAAGKGVLRFTGGSLGRLAPYVPYVGPWVRTARRGAGLAAAAGGPAAVALGALAVNDAFGTRYERLIPPLLAIARLGPGAVDAETVEC